MSYSRREFLQQTGAAFAVGAAPAHIFLPSAEVLNDSDLFALAEKGVDVAMSMGAEYVDVRITRSRHEKIENFEDIKEDNEWLGVGVRVVKGGHWGFMSSAVWTFAEMERLATSAVKQAEAFGKYNKGEVLLATPPASVARGEWIMPVQYDPFDVPKAEKMDFLHTLRDEINNYDMSAWSSLDYAGTKKVVVFASSTNSQWKQTSFSTELAMRLSYPSQKSLNAELVFGRVRNIRPPAGRGWEYIIDPKIFTEVEAEVEEVKAMRFTVPVEINRYDAVLGPRTVAAVLGATIGGATELGRALGYEANSVGTSFLDRPVEMLGNYQIGNPKLTVTADRTMQGGLNTVKWDDEAVPAQKTTLVNNGVLADFQTTRETAMHLAPYYEQRGQSVSSNGCASSQSGLFFTTQHTCNLHMAEGDKDISFYDLVGQVDRGVALMDVKYVEVDFQCLNATVVGSAREIRKGKLERYINDSAIMIRTPEFWKSMMALGGASSRKDYGFICKRGQPEQALEYSVSAVPAIFQNVGLINETAR